MNPLDAKLDRLGAELRVPPPEDVSSQHLSAIVAAASGRASVLRPRRRWLKVSLVAGAVLIPAGGAAATGNLPRPAQEAVSRIVNVVGISIPTAQPATSATTRPGSDHGKDGNHTGGAAKTDRPTRNPHASLVPSLDPGNSASHRNGAGTEQENPNKPTDGPGKSEVARDRVNGNNANNDHAKNSQRPSNSPGRGQHD